MYQNGVKKFFMFMNEIQTKQWSQNLRQEVPLSLHQTRDLSLQDIIIRGGGQDNEYVPLLKQDVTSL